MEQQEIDQLVALHPIVGKMIGLEEVVWFNPRFTTLSEGLPYVGFGQQDIDDAAARLLRFTPYFVKAFPETTSSGGIIESELAGIPHMQTLLSRHFGRDIPGRLWLKKDSHLPISGSIKARGGIYEVLCHAEALASEARMLGSEDDHAIEYEKNFFFS